MMSKSEMTLQEAAEIRNSAERKVQRFLNEVIKDLDKQGFVFSRLKVEFAIEQTLDRPPLPVSCQLMSCNLEMKSKELNVTLSGGSR